MPRFSRVPLLLASFLALLSGAHAHAQTCGVPLTHDVTLQADLVCPGAVGILIGADGVVVNLNGFSIVGPHFMPKNPVIPSVGITSSGFNKITITGGTIRGFNTPIYMQGGERHYIGGVYAVDDAGEGLQLNSIRFSTIQDNEFEAVWLYSGFYSGAIGNRIQRNRLHAGSTSYRPVAFRVEGCRTTENTFVDNDVTPPAGQYPPVLTVTYGAAGNNFVRNFLQGTVELYAPASQLRGNRIEVFGLQAYAILVYGGLGSVGWLCQLATPEGSSNTIEGNEITGAISGVRLQADWNVPLARKNRITGNTFRDQSSGIFFTGLSEDNDGRSNTYINVGVPVHDLGVGNLWP